ncbi:prepilin-type N-terminal cleavage/methylation domain-containing protein [Mesobacillus maritimus]|uniref:competence type IV pilus major pilin ComGC n=1 Tax=Mesobacillus maritimus TaxID=1643336 RepID=UPI00203B22FF|nr:competence type IV pilus major pilin ComGC [Mesobacillus maritimus]MCM3586350.1 prepilin-type N-terminal cleavage/methylation domain-containing protein [Mesobacillus maritimus]MCM3669618.1 prepilin-type N-terminal cleavage/methylation domain-containing protein [Mesobacillus maritimus]
MKNEHGFTLIEMMIVLLVISVLLMITVPNITKHNATINKKGCEAYVKMVEGQVQAYNIDHKKLPTSITELVSGGYLNEGETTCPDGKVISISAGKVAVVD